MFSIFFASQDMERVASSTPLRWSAGLGSRAYREAQFSRQNIPAVISSRTDDGIISSSQRRKLHSTLSSENLASRRHSSKFSITTESVYLHFPARTETSFPQAVSLGLHFRLWKAVLPVFNDLTCARLHQVFPATERCAQTLVSRFPRGLLHSRPLRKSS